ncbi:MAG: hypothetical protein WC123_07265 [Bacilli bacterium]
MNCIFNKKGRGILKAKDYFEKYKETITTEKGLQDLLTEMSTEVADIGKQRNIKTDAGLTSILREMNQKWNSLARMFEKEFNMSILKMDGFKSLWEMCLKIKL